MRGTARGPDRNSAGQVAHCRAGGKEAKLWLYPSVRIAFCDGFSRVEQVELVRVVELHVETIRSAWNEHFGESDDGSL